MDNSTIIDRYFLAEPAVSYFIEVGQTEVLFDAAYSDAFLNNAAKLGIEPEKADYLVLSHGHIDHTGGLDPLIKRCMERRFEDADAACPELVAHPSAFVPKTIDEKFSIGMFVSREACAAHMKIRESRQPVWLTDRLVFLGEIERRFDFEQPGPIGLRHEASGTMPDNLPDDTALAYIHEKGIVVITGCSHAGICNITEQAKRITGIDRVYDIIGGFHLLEPSKDQLEGTAEYLASLELPVLSACHCTDFNSRVRLAQVAPMREIGSGLSIEY
jgi:7,8-dihydropterin-6-yl-methyl-4-(beta-D-ribofuranosyl)aminobenzene 5'-phosphate synthase